MTITQETFELLKFTGAGYEPKDIFNSAKTAAVKAVDEYMEGTRGTYVLWLCQHFNKTCSRCFR
jgi:hypothetical protein